ACVELKGIFDGKDFSPACKEILLAKRIIKKFGPVPPGV
ncbi:unnamed protein product, partial [marine sediment metagenome]